MNQESQSVIEKKAMRILSLSILSFLLLAACSTTSTSKLEREKEALEFLKSGGNYYKDGKYKKAVNSYKWSIELMPDNAVSHYNLGVAYERLNMYDEAIESYRKAFKINNEDPLIFYSLGVVYSKT
jgi:tetratricopeptide (TPR) repeat protein